jgi:hypothetical protein
VYDPFGFKSGNSKFGNTINRVIDWFESLLNCIFGGLKNVLISIVVIGVFIAFFAGLFAHGFVFGVIAIALIMLIFK